jgi:protein-tyrosine phosphatase
MAQTLLSRALAESGASANVTSAGIRHAPLPVDPVAVRVLRDDFGLDMAMHRGRQVTREIIATDGADLVLTMTRAHLRSLIALEPSAFARTFTIRELARRTPTATDRFDTWIARAHEGRTATQLLHRDPADDVDDPYERGEQEVRRTARLLTELATGLSLGPWGR